MAKLPTALLPRSLPSSSSSSASSTLFSCSATHRPTSTLPTSTFLARTTQQVRHATKVERPKRPFTWTQIIQLSDGSTYTTRTTAPLSVYRSSKDTRNHARWQPHESSLQNVEVDEAGKLASFRKRFGGAFDIASGPAPASQEPTATATEGGNAAQTAGAPSGQDGKKAQKAQDIEAEEALATARAAEAEEGDVFADLMSSFVVDQPQLKGGRIAGKDTKKGKKK